VRGEVPIAYIVTTSPVDHADLASLCREKLASFKVPRSFIVVDKLPRNALGKIQKHLLQTKLDLSSYELRPAIFAPYDQRAPAVALLLARAIQQQDTRLLVDHIGSTSVPGCSGKGIIDLAVTYAEGDLDHAKRALDMLGFQPQPGREPFPESRPMRVADVSGFGVHAHVIQRNGAENSKLISFRNALLSDHDFRAAYQQEKERILESGITDSLDYCKAKELFIVRALSRIANPLK
jgi:GrpB-like predicted nucleotidyltransferase (UPF0157 family)